MNLLLRPIIHGDQCLNVSVIVVSLLLRLKPIDITFMKMLHTKVNIVPVIAKADCLTKFEVQRLKRKVSTKYFPFRKHSNM